MDSKELRSLLEAYSEVYAPEQLDESEKLNELSDRKLRAYVKKSEKSHQDLNKKWDQGTATYKDKYKSINREYGQERALKRLNKEELDIFDVVLEFLQAEGYAETLEEAEWMMANLIDEEAIDIILGEGNPIGRFLSNRKHKLRDTEKGHEDIMRRNREYQTKGKGPGGYRNKGAGRIEKVREEYVDEAQAARENPEKYEREQAKKSAPVRGERTPMPPRGDKRREDFEKWYAKNVH